MVSKSAYSMANQAATTRPIARTLAGLVGALFLLIGIMGFIPGITTNFDEMQFAGHESNAKLLGIIQVSVLHNLVHLGFGVAGLALARSLAGARAYLIGGGAIYAVLWLYGLIVSHDSPANFVPFNNAGNWLHLLLAIGMIGLGLATTRGPRAAGRTQR